jgi:hypothetical protein
MVMRIDKIGPVLLVHRKLVSYNYFLKKNQKLNDKS